MPVFDFNNTPEGEKAICTYETFKSIENKPSANKPIMLLDKSSGIIIPWELSQTR